MDLGKAFSYIFDDDQWIQVILIGGLLLFVGVIIPVIGWLAIYFLLTGFTMEIARNVAMGSPRPLARWNNLGDMLSKGFYGWVVQVFYLLPVVLLALVFTCIAAVIAISGGDDETVLAVIVPLTLCLTPLTILMSLVLQPIALAGWVRYLQTGSLSAALRVGEVIAIVRANLGTWVVLWLLMVLCSIIANLGSVALMVGALFTTIYAQAVFGHLLGQVLAQMAPADRSPYAPPAGPFSV